MKGLQTSVPEAGYYLLVGAPINKVVIIIIQVSSYSYLQRIGGSPDICCYWGASSFPFPRPDHYFIPFNFVDVIATFLSVRWHASDTTCPTLDQGGSRHSRGKDIGVLVHFKCCRISYSFQAFDGFGKTWIPELYVTSNTVKTNAKHHLLNISQSK